ncbi:unnamed protein product [Triticum aestivum]|uniref:Uncharacterized protein n=2 Tax=Triticum aestivum TaxID=4565 RepID=A0A9R1EPI5_WHEAT|nr:hypothetical protein CFC21_028189 [Triticum aestivum]SPT16426.1 unnamed protein product [Triticum aestivum]
MHFPPIKKGPIFSPCLTMSFCLGFSYGFAAGLPKPVVDPRPRVLLAAAALDDASDAAIPVAAPVRAGSSSRSLMPFLGPVSSSRQRHRTRQALPSPSLHQFVRHPAYAENAADVAIPVVAPVRAGSSRMTSGRIRSMAVFMFYCHCCKDTRGAKAHVNEADGDDVRNQIQFLGEVMQPRIVFGRRRAWPLALLDGFFALPPELQVARTSEAELLC